MDLASKPFLHLALQWQGQNQGIMLRSFCREHLGSLPGCFVSDMQRFGPWSLVVIKAWCGEQDVLQGQFPWIKQSSTGTWLRRSAALDEWLASQEPLPCSLRKDYGLMTMPGIIWRPIAPSKAELRQAQQFPQWVKTAFEAALYILGESAVPLTIMEVAEQCNGIYSEKTLRNALNHLRTLKMARANKTKGEPASWLLSSSGERLFHDHQTINRPS